MGLTFIRHTQPDVAKGMCYGRTDLDVADSFLDDANRAVASLGAHRAIFTSPLKRCRKLSDFIGESEVLDAVIEMDFGAWEMVPWDAVPRDELNAWAADFDHAKPHGGESVAELRTRVEAGISELPDGSLIVTHHGVIKAAAVIFDHPEGWDITVGFGESIRF